MHMCVHARVCIIKAKMESERICNTCRIKKPIQSFHKNGSKGRHFICSACRNEKRKTWNKSWENAPDRIYQTYKRSAKKRGLEFNLTIEDFSFSKPLDCFYCGSLLDRPRYDRVNNKIGYCKENIVFCCRLCNFLKNDLEKEIFLDHISKIYEYQKGK